MMTIQDKPLTRRDHAGIEGEPHIRGTHASRSITANYTATSRDWFIIVDASSGSATVTLPPAKSMKARGELLIQKSDSSSNAVTVDGAGSETINGDLTRPLSSQFEIVRLVSDGSNWLANPSEAQLLKMLGVVFPLENTFVSPAGATGTDNTAQTVKTVVVPANTLTQVNDRLRIRAYWTGTTGGGITGTTTLNGVTIAAATDGGGADFFTTEAWLHYIDNSTANLIETGAYPATGSNSQAGLEGFNWASNQDVDIDQDQVANNHIIVYAIFLDVFPKGSI